MGTKRILFVEDDEGQRQLFDDAIREWNVANAGNEFSATMTDSVDQARDLLKSTRFDCALFDLKLPKSAEGGKGHISGGNELAEIGLRRNGIPVGIVSGKPTDLDQKLVSLGLLETFDKGDDDAYSKAVAWFADKWLMMEILADTKEQIQISGAEVFANRVWPNWKNYEGLAGENKNELKKVVVRQYVSHIAELLGLDDPENASWHPFENYIQPPSLSKRAHTGDIFCFDDELWIVMSPQCDMATGKAKNVVLVHCDRKSLAKEWEEKVPELSAKEISRSKADARDSFFRKLVNQGDLSRHFLPPLEDGSPIMVSFKDIMVRSNAELIEALDKRIASVAPPFLPNLIQRFGAYMSRTGQPNIDFKHFAKGA